MMSATDELEKFWNRNADLFFDSFLKLASSRLGKADYSESIEELAELLRDTLMLSNLYGRKRMLMESDAVRAKVKARFDADGKTPLSRLTFEEAVEDLVSREPRLVKSADELARLYTADHVFGMARSIDEKLTSRVQQALADFIRKGESYPSAAQVLQEITPFSRQYSDLVYRTNLNTNYTAGRFQQAQDEDVREVIPALMFVSQHDERTRPNHRAAHGMIAATDDPIWRFFRPPIGYACRCGADFVSVFELMRRGLWKGGKVVRYLPPSFGSAKPDPKFKPGLIGWEAA